MLHFVQRVCVCVYWCLSESWEWVWCISSLHLKWQTKIREIIELAKPVLQILRTSNYIDIRFYIHKNENPFYSYNCVGLTKACNINSIHWKSGEQRKKNGACIILLSPWLPLHCSYINYDKEWYICRYFQRYANDFKRLVAIWEICTSDLVWMTFTFCAFFFNLQTIKSATK